MNGMQTWVTVRDVLDDLPDLDAGEISDTVPDHSARNHRERTVSKYDDLDGGEVPHDGFSPRRLYSDEPSFTVTVSQGKSPIHHEEARMLTPRELCRLQTLPDSFELPIDGRVEKCRVIGNAVPPVLAQSVVDALP